MPLFDRKTVTPHQHAEALKHLLNRRERIIKAIAKSDVKIVEHARALYYIDHAINSVNDGQGQSGDRLSFTDA